MRMMFFMWVCLFWLDPEVAGPWQDQREPAWRTMQNPQNRAAGAVTAQRAAGASVAQRKPTWLLPVSGGVPRRAAGR